MKNKTITYYQIKDLDHPMYHPETFNTFEEAKKVLDVEYTNRNKNDGHNDYWRNRRTGIQRVTVTTELLFDNKNAIEKTDQLTNRDLGQSTII